MSSSLHLWEVCKAKHFSNSAWVSLETQPKITPNIKFITTFYNHYQAFWSKLSGHVRLQYFRKLKTNAFISRNNVYLLMRAFPRQLWSILNRSFHFEHRRLLETFNNCNENEENQFYLTLSAILEMQPRDVRFVFSQLFCWPAVIPMDPRWRKNEVQSGEAKFASKRSSK